jgi:hypothetical protein
MLQCATDCELFPLKKIHRKGEVSLVASAVPFKYSPLFTSVTSGRVAREKFRDRMDAVSKNKDMSCGNQGRVDRKIDTHSG